MMEFVDKAIHTNSNQIPKKGNTMATSNNPEFEVVNSTEISFVKRGRKSKVNPALVEALKTLGVGKAMAVKSLAVDPKSANFANEKARIASQIRTACREAKVTEFRILWSPEGIPQIVR